MTYKRKASLRIRLGLFFVTLLMALAAFEAVCRLAGVDFNPNPYWRFHPHLGWTQERSKAFTLPRPGEAPIEVEFNSLGFRDVEHSVAKPSGKRRLVVTGDSFSEAIQVNLDETFWRRLQDLLNDYSSDEWEVINLGVGDYGTAQELLALQRYGLSYSPDVVVSQIFPLNDICNNAIEMAGLCKSRNDIYRPYFVLRGGSLKPSWVQPFRQTLRSGLYSFGVVEKTYLTFVGHFDKAEVRPDPRATESGFAGDPLLYTYVEEKNQPTPIANGWRVTEGILSEMARICGERGIVWLPLVIPFEARVGPGWKGFAVQYPTIPMVQDYPEKRLSKLFDSLEAPSVMVRPLFERNLDLVFPGRGGHLNPEAHRLVAESLFERLKRLGVLKPNQEVAAKP